jgi:hypothetical protein
MSSTTAQDQWYKFLNESLSADQQEEGDAEQRENQIAQEKASYAEADAIIQSTIEQAKTAATEAGANLIGIGGMETIRAVKGLYTSGKALYSRVQQMKDIGQKLIAQKEAKTARIEQLKEQKYNEAQARNAEIDPLTGQAKGPVIDKEQFMADADTAIAKAGRDAMISQVRGAVADRLNPIIDNIKARAPNTIDAIGSQVEGGVTRLTNAASSAADYVKNGFAHYTDTANQVKQDYLDRFSKTKGYTDDQLSQAVSQGKARLSKFADEQQAAGIEGIDEHISTVTDLLNQGTRQSVAAAGAVFKDVKSNVTALKPYKQLKDAQKGIDDAKVTLEQGKADAVNQLNETRQNIQDKLDVSRGRLDRAQSLPENAKEFQNAGTTKSEAVDSIQKDIDAHNLDLENAINDTSSKLSDLETASASKIADLQSVITQKGSEILDAAGGATTDILTRINRGVSSAISTAGDAIANVRSAIAPVTDVVGAIMTPVAIYQGALSAENIFEGKDWSHPEQLAMDAVNVRFGAGAVKGVIQAGADKVSSLISGNKQASQANATAGENAEAQSGKKSEAQAQEVEDNYNTEISNIKSEGTAAGEDIADDLGDLGGDAALGEDVTVAAAGSELIPVVGEVVDVALAGFSLYEGIKSFFGGGDSGPALPPPPPPPPMVTSSVSFAGQAGVY